MGNESSCRSCNCNIPGKDGCLLCTEPPKYVKTEGSDNYQLKAITTAQIISEPNDLMTQNNRLSMELKMDPPKRYPKAYDTESLNAITIQKVFRGHLKREEFKRNLELMNNVLTLESTSFNKEEVKSIKKSNKGEQLYRSLIKSNLLSDYPFKKKPPSKYLIEVPLTFIDKESSDDLYEGQMTLNKVKSGYGIFYTNDNKYEGNWDNDKLNGYSRMFLSNGDYFEGDLVNGIVEGKGKFVHKNGSIYDGNWMNDKPNGYGKETYIDGSVFEGEFRHSSKYKGKLSWPDGSYYIGEIKANVFDGQGLFHWNEGREYDGSWKDGKMSGKGTMRYNNGNIYEGEFLNGKRNGHGIYRWNDNKYYEGEWRDGIQNGNGVYKKKDKTIRGIWSKGLLIQKNCPDDNFSVDLHKSNPLCQDNMTLSSIRTSKTTRRRESKGLDTD